MAANILGAQRVYSPVPTYWSEQYDTMIQVAGEVPPGVDAVVTDGAIGDGSVAALFVAGGVVVGAVGWNHARGYRSARRWLVGPAVQ